MTPRTAARALLAPAAILILASLLATPATAFPERTGYDREWPALGHGDFVLADLTGDGWTDLAAVDDGTGTLRIYEGGPTGIPRDPKDTVVTGPVSDLALADVDGDGRQDLLAVGGSKVTRLSWDEGRQSSTFSLDSTGTAIAAGDFSGDGRPDIVVLGTTGALIWIQQPGGSFESNATLTVAETESFQSVVAGDVNGDGRVDLVLAKSYELRAYLQGALGLDLIPVQKWTYPGDVSLDLLPTGGGVPLLALVGGWGPTADATAGLWRWDYDRLVLTTSIKSAYAVGVGVGDANDDGKADLVLVRADGSAEVFYQKGGAIINAVPDLRLVGAGPIAGGPAGIGDVNGDGFGDVVVRTTNPDRFIAYLQEDAEPVLVQPIPSTFAVNGGTYARAVIDLSAYFVDDHDRLTFTVVYASNADLLTATVDGDALNFEASSELRGVAEFRVSAWDGNPSHAPLESNPFSVLVNDAPTVIGAPSLRASVGRGYAYVVTVADTYPEGDTHTFALLTAPDGMTIDPATGLVRWTPTEAQTGANEVVVEVRDGHGGVTLDAFTIVVAPIEGGSPAALMAVGLVGTTAALMAAAALINENAKWAFLLFFLPMYSKIKRERVLDHFVRGQIFGYIQANPGEHYNAIKDALGLTNGSLAHHLRTLEREQFVKSRRFGLYRRFYPMHFRIPEAGEFQPNDIQTTILDVIKQAPGITQKEIAMTLGLTPPTVNYHIAVLSDHNLIRVDRQGRSTHCSIVEGPT